MPRKVSQKQRQRQTVIVNVGTKTKSRTKRKSTSKRGKSNVAILPAPNFLYTSPIHNLTPQYFSQGQQVPIPSLAQQQGQKVGSQIQNSYFNQSQPSGYSLDDISELSSIYSNPDSAWKSRSEMSNDPYYSLSKEMSSESSRQNNEEFLRNYYKDKSSASANNSLDNDLLQRMDNQMKESNNSSNFYDMLNRIQEKTYKEIEDLETPAPFRRPDRRPPVRIELDEESITYGTPSSNNVNVIPYEDEMSSSYSDFSSDSLNTLNPYPKNIYNKIMGYN